MSTAPTLITAQPGIRRDGTRLESQHHTDGRWVRFDDGKARKMGGYLALSRDVAGLARGMHGASISGSTYFHLGTQNKLQQMLINHATAEVQVIDRTPVGLEANVDNLWTFDEMFDVIDGKWKIIAHVATNLRYIDNPARGTVYIGQLNDVAPLVPVKEGPSGSEVDFKVAGGLCCVHPFAFYFDNDGTLIWSVSNKPSNVTDTFNTGTNIPAGNARPTGKKIVAGRPLMGLGVPGGLFWSLDTLVRAAYIGGNATWDFDEVSSIEVISARSIVEYNGVYFWIGARRFISYAGQVKDVPNSMNRRWFFDNLTKGQEGKIFGFAVPSCGEIWWCAPMFGSSEPNHAVILNVNNGTWYDTPLPGLGRSSAVSPSSIFPYPVMTGVDEVTGTSPARYRLWQHETGVDEVDGRDTRAVRSYYITNDITMLRAEKPDNGSTEVMEIEPDFVQKKDLTVTVYGNANSRAPTIIGDPATITEPASGMEPGLETIELRGDHRQMRFKFESNIVGGDYEAGATYAQIKAGSQRTTT